MQTLSYIPLNKNIVGLGGQVHKENQIQYRANLFNQTHKNKNNQTSAYASNEYLFKKPNNKKLSQNNNLISLCLQKPNLYADRAYLENYSKETEQFSNDSCLTDISSKNIIAGDSENDSKIKNIIQDYKKQTENDPQSVSEYADEILHSIIEDQNLNKPKYESLAKTHITIAARNKLINWLMYIHYKYNLLEETFMLTVNMIDRVIQSNKITQEQLQLYGLTCLLIASKYQEIYPPDIEDFRFFTRGRFLKREMLSAEIKIMGILDYSLETVSPLIFFEYYWKVLIKNNNKDVYYLSKMLIELCLFSPKMMQFNYSLLVAATLNIAFKITKKEKDLDFESLCFLSEHTKKDIFDCNLQFYSFSKSSIFTSRKNEVLKKYSKNEFLNVGQKFLKANY